MKRPTFLERLRMDGQAPAGVPEADPDIGIREAIERRKAGEAEMQRAEVAASSRLLEEMTSRPIRNIGDKALEALAVIKAERKLIATIRQALKEYDRYVRPDRRVNNGKKRVDPGAVAKGLKLMKSGMSIRTAAKLAGISFGTLWKAKERLAKKGP